MGNGFEQFVIAGMIIIGVLVVGSFVFAAGKGLAQWSSNNAQPVQRVPAKIVARRTNLDVSSHHHDDHPHHHTSTSSQYYATFELENGQRLEFQVPDKEAGLLLEGDEGQLTCQGTRYLGFARWLRDGTLQGNIPEGSEPAGELSGAVCVRCEKPLVVGRTDCPACGWAQPA